MTIVRPTGGSAANGDGLSRRKPDEAASSVVPAGVPASMRAERLEEQIALFVRAGYVVEQRMEFRAVMVRESRRPLRSRVFDVVRTIGAVPVLLKAPQAYHRVLVIIEDDGAVRLI